MPEALINLFAVHLQQYRLDALQGFDLRWENGYLCGVAIAYSYLDDCFTLCNILTAVQARYRES